MYDKIVSQNQQNLILIESSPLSSNKASTNLNLRYFFILNAELQFAIVNHRSSAFCTDSLLNLMTPSTVFFSHLLIIIKQTI